MVIYTCTTESHGCIPQNTQPSKSFILANKIKVKFKKREREMAIVFH